MGLPARAANTGAFDPCHGRRDHKRPFTSSRLPPLRNSGDHSSCTVPPLGGKIIDVRRYVSWPVVPKNTSALPARGRSLNALLVNPHVLVIAIAIVSL